MWEAAGTDPHSAPELQGDRCGPVLKDRRPVFYFLAKLAEHMRQVFWRAGQLLRKEQVIAGVFEQSDRTERFPYARHLLAFFGRDFFQGQNRRHLQLLCQLGDQ